MCLLGEADLGSFGSMLRLAACAWECSDEIGVLTKTSFLSTNVYDLLTVCHFHLVTQISTT